MIPDLVKRRPRHWRIAVGTLLLGLVLSACGGSNDGTTTSAATVPVSASATTATSDASPTATAKAKLNLKGVGEKVSAGTLTDAEVGRSTTTAGPNAAAPGNSKLTLHPMGSCQDVGGLWFLGRGFTPDGNYKITATYPPDAPEQGAPYTYLDPVGQAVDDGSTPHMRWDCKKVPQSDTDGKDSSGIYTMEVTDASGDAVKVRFVVDTNS